MKSLIVLLLIVSFYFCSFAQTTFFTKFPDDKHYSPRDITTLSNGNILCCYKTNLYPLGEYTINVCILNTYGEVLYTWSKENTAEFVIGSMKVLEFNNKIYLLGNGNVTQNSLTTPIVSTNIFDYYLQEEFSNIIKVNYPDVNHVGSFRVKPKNDCLALSGNIYGDQFPEKRQFYMEISDQGDELCFFYNGMNPYPIDNYDFQFKQDFSGVTTFNLNWTNNGRPFASIRNHDSTFTQVSEFLLPTHFFSGYSTLKLDESTYYFAGNIYDTVNVQIQHLGIIKVSDEGNVLNEFYSYNLQDSCTNIAFFNSLGWLDFGSVMLCSSFNVKNPFSLQQFPSYIRLTKFSANLDLLWDRYIGGEGMYEAYSMRTTPDNGILVVGCYSDTPPNGSTKKEMIIFKTDGNGLFTGMNDDQVKITSSEAILYPNPARDILNVEFSMLYKKATFSLTDISGKTALVKQLTANRQSINISAIPAGTYVFRIFNKNGLDERGKIVVE